MNAKPTCLLCGSCRVRFQCVFVPKNQLSMAAPIGKVRTVLYALCRKCKRKNWQQRVEDALRLDLEWRS